MRLKVLDQDTLEKSFEYLNNNRYNIEIAIISITSASSLDSTTANIASKPTGGLVKDVLFLAFDDVNDEDGYYTLFDRNMATLILNFAKENEDRLIICQCETGVSRSAAVAAALSHIYNHADGMYFRDYVPNALVYRTILNVHYGDTETKR